MKTLEMKQATGELGSYARQVRREAVVVTDHGRPVMALMSLENANLETVSLSTDSRFMALIERSRATHEPGTGIALEDLRRKYAPAPKARSKAARKTRSSRS